MRAFCVDASNEQAYPIRPPSILLRVGLRAVRDAGRDLSEGDSAVVRQARGQRLLLHEVGENTGVRGETSEGYAIVRVDFDNLLLVRG